MKLVIMKTKEGKVSLAFKEPQDCTYEPGPCTEHSFKMYQEAFCLA